MRNRLIPFLGAGIGATLLMSDCLAARLRTFIAYENGFPVVAESLKALVLACATPSLLGAIALTASLLWTARMRARARLPAALLPSGWPSVADSAKLALVLLIFLNALGQAQRVDQLWDLFLQGETESWNGFVLSLGILVNMAVAVISETRNGLNLRFHYCGAFCAAIVASSFILSPFEGTYQYRGEPRASALWQNPNSFGLLCAAALVLLSRLLSRRLIAAGSIVRPNAGRWIILGCYCVAIVVVGFSLQRSFSRGAWLAAVVGLAYLWSPAACHGLRALFARRYRWIAGALLAVIGVTSLACSSASWVARAGSVLNPLDFSWSNRTAAWQESVNMMLDRPFVGFGWAQLQGFYDGYYRSLAISESGAILVNDFLRLGTSSGIAVLVTFLIVGGSPFVRAGRQSSTGDRTVWQAVVAVFLVGFFFDGGLFSLSTAMPFWIALAFAGMDRVGGQFASPGNSFLDARQRCT